MASSPTPAVGIIANPAAGKDIRRLVAHGRFVTNQEKVNILRRVLAGIESVGVRRVVFMPDMSGLGHGSLDGGAHGISVEFVDILVTNKEIDSTRSAEVMQEEGVGCLVTLGGDGTNRAVAKGAGDIPIVPISTGTNNVFPQMMEGTVAGIAAGVVASGAVDVDAVTRRSTLLEVSVDGTSARHRTGGRGCQHTSVHRRAGAVGHRHDHGVVSRPDGRGCHRPVRHRRASQAVGR